MSFESYTALKAEISDYLARGDLDAKIPSFITLAEAKFNREIMSIQMEVRSTVAVDMTSDEPEYISLPADFQSMRRIRLSSVSGKPQLSFKSGVQLDEFRSRGGDVTGIPQFFTVFGAEIELAPSPDSAYTIEMVYRANIPALSDGNTTNWLLNLYPDAYLYGALLEAAPYTKEDSRIQTWATGLTTTLDSINRISRGMTNGAGPLRATASGPTP